MSLILGVLVARLLGNKKVSMRRSIRKAKKESKFLITLFTEIGSALYKGINSFYDLGCKLEKGYNKRNLVVAPIEQAVEIDYANVIDFAHEVEIRKAK